MFTITVKSSDVTLVREHFSTPQDAVDFWHELRADTAYAGLPIGMFASIRGQGVFLTHYFHTEPGTIQHVPVEADLEPIFIAAFAGIEIRPSGRPEKSKTIDWAIADWSMSNADLARTYGVSNENVRQARKRHDKNL